MKILVNIIIILILIGFQVYLPWWTLVFPCVALGYRNNYEGAKSFLFSFVVVFMLWLGWSLSLDLYNPGPGGDRAAQLFFLPSKFFLFLLSALLGAIVAGLSGYVGCLFKKIQKKEKDLFLE